VPFVVPQFRIPKQLTGPSLDVTLALWKSKGKSTPPQIGDILQLLTTTMPWKQVCSCPNQLVF